MRYQDKLTISSLFGGLLSLGGLSLRNSFIMGTGFGLLTSSIIGDLYIAKDEFADLREESHKRERLYNKLGAK